MNIEFLCFILFVILVIFAIPMGYIYSHIILPTNEQNGKDGRDSSLPSHQYKQMDSFIKICEEKNIHQKAKLFTKAFIYILPILIIIVVILMAINL